MRKPQNSYRHFVFDAFKDFLSGEISDRIIRKMESKHRHRCFGLEGFIWSGLLVAAYTSLPNLQQIFDQAGTLLGSITPVSLASVSAFCQYRAKFPLKVMLYLWRFLLIKFKTKDNDTWHGFKLQALDGTLLNSPESLYLYFGASDGCGPGPVQGFLMVLYDLMSSVPIAFRISPAVNEGRSHLILKHLSGHLKAGSLLLIDAGFYSLEIFSFLLKKEIHFVIPMRSNSNPELIKRLGKNDGLYQIKATSYWKNNPWVTGDLVVRIITYQIPGFRPRRLVTSLLDELQYPAEEIIQLYHRRWEIETFFRDFKHTLSATHWHAKTLPAFYSELLFQMLLAVLTRLVMAEAAVQNGISPNQLSFGMSLANVKQALGMIVFLPVSEWEKIYSELIERIKKYRIDIRPNRRFEHSTSKRRQRNRLKYALIIACLLLREEKDVA